MSTQTNYAGQNGWNDLAPDALPVLKNRSDSQDLSVRRPRRVQSQGIELTPQVSRASSISSTSSSIPAPPPRSRQPSTASSIKDEKPRPNDVVSEKEVQGVLRKLSEVLNRCTLSASEVSQSKSRLTRVVPGLSAIHLEALDRAISLNDANSAKAALVEHSMAHAGISSWVIPIRRAIEAGGI